MEKYSNLIRPALKQYKKQIIILIFALIITAYPLYLLSQYISSFFVIEIEYRPANEISVDYNLDVSVYDNQNDTSKFSNIVIENIANAKEEIFIAMYSFNIVEIRDALLEASKKGVRVTIMYNLDRKWEFDQFFPSDVENLEIQYFPKVIYPDDNYHMHHKFMIVDPGTDNEVLLTGPWNWSYYQEDLDPNFLMVIHDTEIIESFKREIDRLSRITFGYEKFRDLVYMPWDKKITYPNGNMVEVWFSPGRLENSVQTRIIDVIETAEESIDIGITIFDSTSIANKLIQKAKEGIPVRIVVNATTVDKEDSIIPWLRNLINEEEIENISIYEGGTRPTEEQPKFSIYHHNLIIIDNKIVVTGTENWTFGGFFSNDENILIFYSNTVAKKFYNIYNDYLNFIINR